MIIDRESVETLVGTKISKIDLYQKAFTHKSALKENENLESFETLEFIGDSVLGFVITKFLFDRYEQQKEGVSYQGSNEARERRKHSRRLR